MHADNPIHQARLACRIPLSEVVARTFLSPRIVQKIDEGAFDQLPGGVYARSYVRTFASLVGLDPESTVAQLAGLLPPAEDPLPIMRNSMGVSAMCGQELWSDWAGAATACATAIRQTCEHLQMRIRRFWGMSFCIAVPKRLFH